MKSLPESIRGDIGQLILFLLFMALWISDMFLMYSVFPNEYVPEVVRLPIGIILLIVSGYMAGTGLLLPIARGFPRAAVLVCHPSESPPTILSDLGAQNVTFWIKKGAEGIEPPTP